MNIKFHTVISDITGKTGQAVVEAIIKGERNAVNFLPFVDRRIKAGKDIIVKSLEGDWREEHLFTLKESYTMYLFYKERIGICDTEIEKQLQQYEASRNEGLVEAPKQNDENTQRIKKTKDKNHPSFDVRGYLERIMGWMRCPFMGSAKQGGWKCWQKRVPI